jgi:hypothetical protein
MPTRLLDLELDELSLVDAPANEHAQVLLTKARNQGKDGLAAAQEGFAREIAAIKKACTDFYVDNPEYQEDTMSQDAVIAKKLAEDVAKGKLSVLRADVRQLHKARTREIWLARGAPKDGTAALEDEVWQSPLSGMGEPSPEDPSLQQLYDLAPESTVVAKRQADLIVERDGAAVALGALVEKTARDHPDWSRLKALDFAYRTDPGQALRAKHNAAAQRLQEMTP